MFPENLSELTSAALATHRAACQSALEAFQGIESPTPEQIAEGEVALANRTAVDGELAARADLANRAAALRDAATASAEEPEVAPEPEPEPEPEADPEPEAAPEAPAEQAAVEPVAPAAELSTASLGGSRPVTPRGQARRLTITASSDVPDFATGSELADVDVLTEAVLSKFNSFQAPNMDSGEGGDWRKFGLAKINKNFPEDLRITDSMSIDQQAEVIARATDEKRLPQGSLVASGGWCAPSEVMYDLTNGETTDGILSLPEVAVGRGGVKFTLGPDWSDIYGNGSFALTEAQVISGTAKVPFEITCPTFSEVRLDAVGLFVKAPILTEAAYPELVKRWLSGLIISHAHRKNTRRISAIQTALGTTVTPINAGTTAGSLFGTLEFLAIRERAIRRWSENQVLEVILPRVAKALIRQDLALRTGQNVTAITDQLMLSMFAAINLAPQFVVGYQDLAANAVAYPSTFEVMMYKTGTFVEGTADVVNLQTMYDAAGLAGNIYTALFLEEGQSIMKMGYGGLRTSINVCSAGVTGANTLACS